MAGGIQFKSVTAWTFTAGVRDDGSAVKDQYGSVPVPMGAAYRFGLGAQW